jgi:subtilisin family serine protease
MTGVHKTALATTFLIAVLTGWHAAPQAQGPGQPPGQERRRYVVEFNQFGPGAAAAVRIAGGEVAHEFPQFRKVAAWLPETALAALQNNPNVVGIEIDPARSPFAETVPYGISMVQANQVSASPNSGVKVCIIDSGYSLGHPDLPPLGVVNGVDSLGLPWSQDGCGHGTHVAGTIAALGNGTGVVGVEPTGNVGLHIVRVFGDSCAWAYASDLAAALGECQAAGAKVVNMSLGGSVSSTLERNAFDAAYAAGVLSIAAAGNGGNSAISYPAGYSSVVSVAAVDQNEALASFSQRNADVELAAPGVGVLSTVPWLELNSVTVDNVTYNGTWIDQSGRTGTGGVSGSLANGGLCNTAGQWAGQIVLCERGSITFAEKVNNVRTGGGVAAVIYNNVPGEFLVANKLGQPANFVSYQDDTAGSYEAWDGTSMATPHVAGVAALVWSRHTDKSNEEIRNALTASAKDLGPAGRDTGFGYGLVQATAADALLESGVPPSPPQPPPPPDITLTAVRRGKRVDLTWTPATPGTTVDIRRNGSWVLTTPNDGSHSDSISGKGTFVYEVCPDRTGTGCSNPVTVVF